MRVVSRSLTAALAVVLTCAFSITTTTFTAPTASAADRDIVVWVPKGYKKATRAALPAEVDGHRIRVLVRAMADIDQRLLEGDPQDSPDLVLIDAARTGELAGAALLVPIELKRGTQRALSEPGLNSFRFGFNIYGVPIQIRNVALVTNADLVPEAPNTFRKLRRTALDLKREGKIAMPLALGQEPTDPASQALYPLFAGLGGFVFGTNAGGSVDPTKVGLNNSAFRENSERIDTWNATGLIDSTITTDQAREAFLAGQAPFWIASPDDIEALTEVDFRYRISAVPRIVKGQQTSPLVHSTGLAVTTFARQHDVLEEARALVQEIAPGARAQRAFYESSPLVGLPANENTAANISNRQLIAFGAAGSAGIAYPNIEQWSRAQVALVGAWRQSTRGVNAIPPAVPAADAFAAARSAVRQGSA